MRESKSDRVFNPYTEIALPTKTKSDRVSTIAAKKEAIASPTKTKSDRIVKKNINAIAF